MGEGHEHYEELAVGHVLGGLPAASAATFRSHLDACPSCRSRVEELRGIADDLAAAEREELARAAVRTRTSRRATTLPASDPLPQRIGIRHVTVAVVAVALLATAMAFWNLHLRAQSATYLAAAEARGDALRHLAAGDPVAVESVGPVRAVAARDGGRVAVSVAGVAPLDDRTWLVAWLRGGADGDIGIRLVGPGELRDGSVAFALEHRGAHELLITRESSGSAPEPTTPPIVTVALG